MLIPFYQTILHHILEDGYLQNVYAFLISSISYLHKYAICTEPKTLQDLHFLYLQNPTFSVPWHTLMVTCSMVSSIFLFDLTWEFSFAQLFQLYEYTCMRITHNKMFATQHQLYIRQS